MSTNEIKQDEIIRMAKESGAVERYFGNQLHGIAFHKKDWLEHFFNIAFEAGAKHEREACAKVCEGMPLPGWKEELAAAIRARGEK